jgi:hypothetical protein
MDTNEEFREEHRTAFLAKLCESYNYDTTSGADAFKIGKQVHFDDVKNEKNS